MPYEQTLARLEKIESKQFLLNRIPQFLRRYITNCFARKRKLLEENRHATQAIFEQSMAPLVATKRHLTDEVTPFIQRSEPSLDYIHSKLAEIVQAFHELSQLRNKLHIQYVTQDEIAQLDSLQTTFAECKSQLETKLELLHHLKKLTNDLLHLQTQFEPYTSYQEYMMYTTEQSLQVFTTKLVNDLNRFTAQHNVKELAPYETAQLDRINNTLHNYTHYLHNYNTTFMDREIEAFALLFTNIDKAGRSLNRMQCEAILKNDRYNQVIAAAGTGKTLVLTYRIQYLILKGIEPSRIIALTYTQEAKEEMKGRLRKLFNITDVHVHTLHSFSLKVVNEDLPYKIDVIEEHEKLELIRNAITHNLKTNLAFRSHFSQYHTNHPIEADFATKEEYVKAMREAKYLTIAGERVKSYAEKAIADFLKCHNIRYHYEKTASWADQSPDKGLYKPDFFLPDYNIYIEHWGVNQEGEIAPWFNWTSEQYQQKMDWARKQFDKHQQILLEMYDFEYWSDECDYETHLAERLKAFQVPISPVETFQLINQVFAQHEQDKIVSNFIAFISKARTNNMSPEMILTRLNKKNKRQFHFGQCAKILLQQYQQHLIDHRKIDFDGMIYQATEIIKANPERFYSRFDHMLVDEFQDVSMNHINLIQPFFQKGSSMRLFCVGDDWQSIYSFQGSEPKYFIDFEEYFGKAAKTYITENFRCPKMILEAGNRLIAHNKKQIPKEVIARSSVRAYPQVHRLSEVTPFQYKESLGSYTAGLIEHLLKEGVQPRDIMVLCRFDEGAPYINVVKQKLKERHISIQAKGDRRTNPNAISIFSVHQSKGREADHVIILHVAKGKLGFPPEPRKDALMEPVTTVPTNTMEEERRLFYVAITRAKKSLHIMTKVGEESPFVEEMMQSKSDKTIT